MTIRDALALRLGQLLQSTSVYPNYAWVAEDGGVTGPLPAVVYRQLGGERYSSGDCGADDDFQTSRFLVEAFAREAAECHAIRRLLDGAFPGPPTGSPDRPGEPARWAAGGPTVLWAEAADPAADAEFPANVAHELLCFEQTVLTVTHTR